MLWSTFSFLLFLARPYTEKCFFFSATASKVCAKNTIDYTSIVLVIVALLAAMNWTLYANRHYKGPKVLLLASH